MAALNTHPQQREIVDFETREPKFPGFLKKAVGLILREDENGDMYVREVDGPELDARDPKFFGFLKKAAGLVLREDENGEVYVARDYDDIDAREPKFFGFLKKAAGLVLRETPEFDELD